MARQRKPLRGAVSRFAEDLRGLTQQLNDGVSFLSRATQIKPCAGPRDFREVLSDLQDEVSDLTTEVEVLERFTVDAISFEELLGHCLALYQANRSTIQVLETHLQQYGYTAPPGVAHEPENPVSAAAVAATARARRAGMEDEDEGFNTDEDERDGRCTGAQPSGRPTAVRASALVGAGEPSTRSRAAGRYAASGGVRGPKQVVMVTPGGALTSATAGSSKRTSTRTATPGGKLGTAVPDSEDDYDNECDGCGRANDMDCSNDDSEEEERLHARRTHYPGASAAAAAGGPLGPRPTGTLSGKGQVLAVAQAASWSTALTAAASVRASARKAPRPSVDSHGSATPEPMLMSPHMAQMLAKYNLGSDADPGLVTLPSTGDGGAGGSGGKATSSSTPGSEEVTAAMRGMSPFGVSRQVRGTGPAAGALAKQHQVPAAPAEPAVAWTQRQQQQAAATTTQQSRGCTPPSEEDTCALYHELIRSRDVAVASLAPQRPRPTQPQQVHPVPPLKMAQAAAAAQQHQQRGAGAMQSRIPSQRGPAGPPVAEAAAAFGTFGHGGGMQESCTPPPTVGAANGAPRSATPARSLPRSEWPQHDVLLEEKFAGLKRDLAQIQPSRSNTPLRTDLRKSLVGISGIDAGGKEGLTPGGNTIAAALALARAQSPAPSRAATEAFAAAKLLTGGGAAALTGGRVAATGSQAPQQEPWRVPRINVAAPYLLEEADMVRVLSPVQNPAPPPPNPAGAAAATPPGRGGSRLPGPAGATTVVGATVVPRQDIAVAAATMTTPKGTPKQPARGAPGRHGRGPTTPGRAPHQQSVSPIMGTRTATTPGRTTGAITPGRVTRPVSAVMGASAAAVSNVQAARGPRATPPSLRKSCTASLPSMAEVEAAVAREAATTTAATTPGRASRTAVVAGSGTTVDRTPGRIRMGEARGQCQAVACAVAPVAAACAVAPVAATSLFVAAAAARPVVPQLRIQTSNMHDGTWGSDGGSADEAGGINRRSGGGASEWGGFAPPPASSGGGAEFDVMLSMPPAGGTPTALTPGRATTPGGSFGEGAGWGVPAAAMDGGSGPAAVLAGLSPNTSQMVSRALGESFMGQLRPQPSTTSAGLGSRIPAHSSVAASAAAAATRLAANAAQPSTQVAGITDSWRISPSTASLVAAAAALPLPTAGGSVAACCEDEWRTLPARTQQQFPLEALNQHLRALAAAVASRPGGLASPPGCFAVSDVEALSASLTTNASKQLINTLVKLGRCEVAAAAGGTMQYRIRT